MKYFIKNKHWNIVEDYNIDKILYILIDRYDNTGNVCFVWYNNENQHHRDYNLPAIIWNYILNGGDIVWYKNGKKYRKITNQQSSKNS